MSKIDNRIKNFGMSSPFGGYDGDIYLRSSFSQFLRSMNNMRGQIKFSRDMMKNRKSKKRRKKK